MTRNIRNEMNANRHLDLATQALGAGDFSSVRCNLNTAQVLGCLEDEAANAAVNDAAKDIANTVYKRHVPYLMRDARVFASEGNVREMQVCLDEVHLWGKLAGIDNSAEIAAVVRPGYQNGRAYVSSCAALLARKAESGPLSRQERGELEAYRILDDIYTRRLR
jgi:hypothetical protein